MVNFRNLHRRCQILRSVYRALEKSTPSAGSSIMKRSTVNKASRSSHGQISSPLRSGHRTHFFLAQIRVTQIPNPTHYLFFFGFLSLFDPQTTSPSAAREDFRRRVRVCWRVISLFELTHVVSDPHWEVHAGDAPESDRTAVIFASPWLPPS